MHITQYLECSVTFAGAAGEVGEDMDGVSISWLPCMGARLVDMLCAASLASWVKLLLMVDAQFSSVASRSFLTLILLGRENLALFDLVSGTRLHFFTAALGFGWKGLLANGVVMVC